MPGYDSTTWYALLAPAKTPLPIVEQLHREMLSALQREDIRENILKQGAEPGNSTRGELGAVIKADIQKWARVVKAAGVKPD